MENNALVQEWVKFAKMDYQTAKHVNETMYPKPLEIICYHCQQAAEKMLKAVLVKHGVEIKKTHDLGLLAELLEEYISIEEEYLAICEDLTPYGVKIRYPQELFITESQVEQALEDTQKLCTWLDGALAAQNS